MTLTGAIVAGVVVLIGVLSLLIGMDKRDVRQGRSRP